MLCLRAALLLAALGAAAPGRGAAAPAVPPQHSPALASFLAAWTGAAPSAAAAATAAACASALPADASIRLDASGLAPGAPPLPFLLRALLDAHPGAAPLAACLVARGAAAPHLLAAHGGALLFAAASPRLLAAGAAAADPGALFRALLAAGVARNFTLGARDGFNVLHKLLSPDKRTVDDAATLLLQPQLQARDAARLAALAQGLAGAPGLPAAAAAAARAAGSSLLQRRLVHSTSIGNSSSSSSGSSSSSAPLGRTAAAAHVHALWRAQSLALLGALAAAPPSPQQPSLAQLAAQRDRFGRTPLHVAALGDCGAAVAALAGALAGALAPAAALRVLRGVDAAGYSPRALAVALGHDEAALALREAAAAAVAAAAAAGEKAVGQGEREEEEDTARVGTFLPTQLSPPAHPAAASAHVAATAGAAAADSLAASGKEEEDSGGWREPVHVSARARAAVAAALAGAPPSGCQIAALPAADFSAALFVRDYFLPARPVLVRGLLRAAGDGWGGGGAPGSGAGAWRAEEFLAAHGDLPVVVQGIPYAATFGEAAGAARSLREFAEELLVGGSGCSASVGVDAQAADACSPSSSAPAPYVFTRLPPAGAAAPRAALRLGALLAPAPPFLARAALPTAGGRALPLLQPARAPGALSPELFLGGPGSGAPMHHHGDAFNALAYGRKAWYLLPPALAEYSSVSAADYVLGVLPGLGGGGGARAPLPLQCTQRAGDVLYVPRGWGHAVLNLNTSVGFAADFTTAMLRY